MMNNPNNIILATQFIMFPLFVAGFFVVVLSTTPMLEIIGTVIMSLIAILNSVILLYWLMKKSGESR
jgi:hypothetical protein